MIHELHDMLRRTGRRLRSVEIDSALALCWLVWAVVGGAIWWRSLQHEWETVWIAVPVAALLTALACWLALALRARDARQIAHRVERRYPELGAALLAALEQAPVARARRLGYLQFSVVREAVHHGRTHDWASAIPSSQLWLARVANVGAFALLVAVCGLLVSREDAAATNAKSPALSAISPARLLDVEVEPGNVELERGTTLLVVARFPNGLPAEVSLTLEDVVDESAAVDAAGDTVDRTHTRSMTRSLDDPQFVGRVAGVAQDMWYRVEFDGQSSDRYRVTVFDYPKLERADARLVYPEFTSLAPKQIEDVRHVTAVEGTELTLSCRLNKNVEEAHLVDRDGGVIELKLVPDSQATYAATWRLEQSRRYKLHLRDTAGRQNKLPPEIVVNVQPNRPPTLKITRPSRDVRVSPLEELELAGDLSDDFGLLRYGVSYSHGGNEPQEIVLFDQAQSDPTVTTKKEQMSYLLDFESLEAQPDQLVSYYVWAEDAVEGGVRQTLGDMFFAEVRHFEEVFREGQQPTQQQQREQQQQQQQGQGNGERAEELAELQKQIVNATWGLVRRGSSGEIGDDVGVVQASQEEAMRQLEELAAELTDEQSLIFVAEARQHMQTALDELTAAGEASSHQPLRPALSAEQAAYQALLRLRAREFNVVQGSPQQQQGSSSGSASGPGSRAQRQLEQLELSADENRYETQSRALSSRDQSASGQQDEARRFLDRLRELARRLEDLNQRLRELQSELEAAETEEEREEIERELKRLREQQQEILRDTDALQSEVENSENREQMEEARQQLEEARSRAQQSSEALEEGRLSEAVTEGTRAGRQLSELRDEFRRRTADRFSEEMRDMRRAAQELDEQQQRLSQMLNEQNDRENLSLRDNGAREELQQGLVEQQRAYQELVERMQETVQEAEEPEPLLARQLYETVQQAVDENVEEALDVTRELLEIGIPREAVEPMRTADRGIEQLRDGVRRAAESVLGDETEALRRAESQLGELADELDREIARAQGQPTPEEGSAESDEAEAQRGSGQPSGERAQQDETQPQADGTTPPRQGSGQQQASGEPTEEDTPPGGAQQSAGEQQEAQRGGGEPSQQPPSGEQQGQEGQGGSAQPEQADEANQTQPPRGGGRGAATPLGERDARGGGGPQDLAGFEEFLEGLVDRGGPITGDDFRPWGNRLRDVEDLLDDPELAAEAARIRDRAEAARAEYKRHSKEPDWEKLTDLVAQPLHELQKRIAEQIRRKESPDALVPIDRDPVPAEYAESVRRYYQRLGSGE